MLTPLQKEVARDRLLDMATRVVLADDERKEHAVAYDAQELALAILGEANPELLEELPDAKA